VLESAAGVHRTSHGAFDVTVAPLLALFRERLTGSSPSEPAAAEIRDTLERVGARHLTVSRRRVSFARDGMAVTLDGIAKGYIVDAMARVLDRHGITGYLVDAGGDIRTRGTREGGHPWTIAVRDPGGGGVYPEVLHLRGGAVATSGSYEVHFDDDLAFHHIVDAATGRSPGAAISVSVCAPTAEAADALATAVFVLGPEAGRTLVDGLRGCGCLVVGRDGRQWKSRRWRSIPLADGDEAGT
jgi:thiamine biosynthesis lipoprotein